MPSVQFEENLKTIYDIAGKNGTVQTSAISKCLRLLPASVAEAIKSVGEKGLVIYEPNKGITLTGEGFSIASKIKRKHWLLDIFLTDILNINKGKAHAKACQLEHVISDDAEIALCKKLNAPAKSPHGCHISPSTGIVGTCNECKGSRDSREQKEHKGSVIPITDLEPCKKGIIKFLRGNQKVVQR